jgi:deoxycytidine triphosphate deaminase
MISLIIFAVILIMVFDDNSTKNRIYKDIYSHMPYELDYSFSDSFKIRNKETKEIIESNDKNVHKVMKDLQSKWIKENIKIENNKVILYKNGQLQKEYILINPKDLEQFKEFWAID